MEITANSSSSINRRGFLSGMLAVGAAPAIIPSSVLGAEAPSNKINIGAIGLGSISKSFLPAFVSHKNARLVAMADCDTRRFKAEWVGNVLKNAYGEKHGVRTTTDFQEVCAASDVDAIVISTNLHWHPYMALLSLKNNKHVFMQKPYAPTAEEGRLIVEAVERKGLVFQICFQRRGGLNFRWAAELALNGELGEIKEVICSTVGNSHHAFLPNEPIPDWVDWKRWCGPCEITPFNKRKLSIWPTELMSQYSPNGMAQCWGCHYLDLAQFGLMREDEMPVTVYGHGAFPYPDSSMTDTALSWDVTLEYAKGPSVHFVENNTNKFDLVHGIRFVGTKGWAQGEDRGFKTSIPDIAKTSLKPSKMPIKLRNYKGGVVKDFIDTIVEGRKECVLTQARKAWHSDLLPQMALHAIKCGTKLHFDPKTLRYTNSEKANKLFAARPYLNGWSLDNVRV